MVVGSTFWGRYLARLLAYRAVGDWFTQASVDGLLAALGGGTVLVFQGKDVKKMWLAVRGAPLPATLAGNTDVDPHVGGQRRFGRCCRTGSLHSLRGNGAGVFQH